MSHNNSESCILLCSECFADHGLMLDAFQIGVKDESKCPNCGAVGGRKLDKNLVHRLADRFFVRGTVHKTKYGGAPIIQFNEHQKTSVSFEDHLQGDARLIEKALGVGFFYYAPRLWTVGEIEPLNSLQNAEERHQVIERILEDYPPQIFSPGDLFYRLRTNPRNPNNKLEYDSPPNEYVGSGRLDSPGYPVLYASEDMEVCIHECRVTVDDLIYVATLTPNRDLRVLDLTKSVLEDRTEFESLSLAVHMLFSAGKHSYPISRHLPNLASLSGYDGILYPSYFGMVRTGIVPYEPVSGISARRLPSFSTHVDSENVSNLAFFGRPISSGAIDILCINRVFINQVAYGISFGPVEY